MLVAKYADLRVRSPYLLVAQHLQKSTGWLLSTLKKVKPLGNMLLLMLLIKHNVYNYLHLNDFIDFHFTPSHFFQSSDSCMPKNLRGSDVEGKP